ncbi:hypothetical protein DZC73_29095 [Albitalea terrae]|uniref:Uncharacterized protein n=2 Tax=Piscinibacter terrae TaxID=2496871 RepID=A0A3N7HI67_9BURK|nr:hypothetical protein DZC73_29095 [Albitalea terrae]
MTALGLLAAGLLAATASPSARAQAAKPADAASAAKPADIARPQVGAPLVAAEALMKQSKFTEALDKVQEAERVADQTPYERYTVARMRSAVAMAAGQTAVAFDATEAAIGVGYGGRDEQRELMASLVHAAYAAKDYTRSLRWADRYLKEGGTRSDIEPLRMQSQYLSGDYAGAAASLLVRVKADEAAGQVTKERDLQLLLNAQRKSGDAAGGMKTVERLAKAYPKPAYWGELITTVDRKTLSERLFIDLFRLMRATGNLTGGQEVVWYAQVSLQAGLAAEALAVIDEAKAKGVLKDQDLKAAEPVRAKAAKQAAEDVANRKKDEAAARASKDGNALVFQGQGAVGEGRVAEGVAMQEQGFAKGGVRRPEENRLRLGEAQLMAGQRDAAQKTFAAVTGPEGMTELSRLWALLASAAVPQ